MYACIVFPVVAALQRLGSSDHLPMYHFPGYYKYIIVYMYMQLRVVYTCVHVHVHVHVCVHDCVYTMHPYRVCAHTVCRTPIEGLRTRVI